MAFKTVNGSAPGPGEKAAAKAATGLSAKNGGMEAGTKKGPSANSGGAPPKVKIPTGGGNFKHPKGSY